MAYHLHLQEPEFLKISLNLISSSLEVVDLVTGVQIPSRDLNFGLTPALVCCLKLEKVEKVEREI